MFSDHKIIGTQLYRVQKAEIDKLKEYLREKLKSQNSSTKLAFQKYKGIKSQSSLNYFQQENGKLSMIWDIYETVCGTQEAKKLRPKPKALIYP